MIKIKFKTLKTKYNINKLQFIAYDNIKKAKT